MAKQLDVTIGRVYDARTDDDGARILVDRIWPRGLSKERADLDEWTKDAAPSSTLRTWYGHDPDRFAEFADRYRAELDDEAHTDAVEHLRALARQRPVTLLTATADLHLSHARVLAEVVTRGSHDVHRGRGPTTAR